MATDKVIGMLLQDLDENTNTENGNIENDSQEIWPKERILRILSYDIEKHSKILGLYYEIKEKSKFSIKKEAISVEVGIQ